MGDDKKDALGNLIDFILSDDTPVGPEDEEDIKLFNDAIAQAEAKLASMRLERARAGAFESGLTSKVTDIGIERAQRRLERARAGDPSAGLTLAARFGDGTLDGDRDAILEDLAELEAEAEDENDEKN